VLLANPGTTPLAPLVQRLLLERSESLRPLWSKARLEGLLLEDVLKTSTGTEPALGVQQVV
jgi:membrane protein